MKLFARDFLSSFGCGFAMGTADIIPGVSGGTMAWILGIYQRLIRLLSFVDKGLWHLLIGRKWRAILQRLDLGFAIPLALGLLSAVFVMVKIVQLPVLMKSHPEPVYGLFFGLIMGSVWLLLRHPVVLRWRWCYFALGVAVGFTIVNLVPAETPSNALIFFGCGMLAISAMLLPGISGSFILLILGKYTAVLDALAAMNMGILLPFVAGVICGLISFSHILNWLLKRYHEATVWIMGGLLVGTLWIIWPFQKREFVIVHGEEKFIGSAPTLPQSFTASENLLVYAMIGLGIALIVLLECLKNRKARA